LEKQHTRGAIMQQ